MMNASFRTAFWAMCLGLTVPMVLFVGVELTSGGRTAANRKAASAITGGSLQGRWTTGDPSRPNRRRSDAGRGDPGVRLLPSIESDPALAQGNAGTTVFLDPRLEPEPGEGPAAAQFPRLPAIPTASKPRIEIDPEDPATARTSPPSRIEAQLDAILGHLDRLVKAIHDRNPPAPDPMRQAADLLQRLQEARRLQELAAKVPELGPPPGQPAAAAPAPEAPPPAVSSDDKRAVEAPPPLATPQSSPPRTISTPAAAQTKIYRPRHIDVRSLEKLVTPILTPGIGRAGAAGGEDDAPAEDGARSLPTDWDALVVRDTPEVLRKVDRLLHELDVPAPQILVEATVVTIRLSPTMPYGVDLAELNSSGQPFSVQPTEPGSTSWPAGRNQPDPPALPPATLSHGTAMKCGILRGDARAFLHVLQSTLQVRGTSASQTTLGNKQSTVLILNDGQAPAGDGTRSGSTATVLRVRPIATRDGLIHLEIRSGLGADLGTWNDGTPFRGTSLGQQLTLRSGESAVVGGFITEHVGGASGRAGAGELPLATQPLLNEAGAATRTETIVLLTPHLAEQPPTAARPVSSTGGDDTLAAPKSTAGLIADRKSPPPGSRKDAAPVSGARTAAQRKPRHGDAGSPRGQDRTAPSAIRQAAAKVPAGRRRENNDRAATATEISSGSPPDDIDGIPPLPANPDAAQRPVIRPGSASRSRGK